MYTFSQKAKLFCMALMAVGVIAIIAGFANMPKSIEDIPTEALEKYAASLDPEAHAAASHHGGGHGTEHHATEEHSDDHAEEHGEEAHTEGVATLADHADELEHANLDYITEDSIEETHDEEVHEDAAHATPMHDTHGGHHGDHEGGVTLSDLTEHDKEHVLHQLQNKPWSALLICGFFFLAIALGATFFLAVQYAAQAGWTVPLLRIMQALGVFLPIGGIILLIVFVSGGLHMNHLYHWMAEGINVEGHANYDKLLADKSGYLNFGFFMIRAVIYLVGWIWAARKLRALSVREDAEGGYTFYRKSVKVSATFLVFFAVTSSMAAWDWMMSVDAHWFSTLFGWYTFAGMFVSALTAITMITLHLKNKGLLEMVNQNHLQDLGKFMFAFSIFWTYLWVSQYLLIWYSNIPEEVTYFMVRFQEYRGPFILALILNFVFPVLVLMSRDSKRNRYFLMVAGSIIIFGHLLDNYVMVSPGTVGVNWSFGLQFIGTFLGIMGLFLFIVLNALTKLPLVQKNHPMLLESKHHHI